MAGSRPGKKGSASVHPGTGCETQRMDKATAQPAVGTGTTRTTSVLG